MYSNDILLSICVPVFNQSDFVKKCLDNLNHIDSNKIEVIISDDCSTEDIYDLVNEYNNIRFIYIKTDKNIGHDLNIIHAIKAAKGKYIYLARNRDLLNINRIDYLLTYIKENDFTYLASSAIDDNSNPKIVYNNRKYYRGKESLKFINKIYIHPSGHIYKRECIDIDEIEKTINEFIDRNHSFIFHKLVLYKLAIEGNFHSVNVCLWTYSDIKAKRAVNSTKNRICVYDPRFEILRYKAEMKYVKKALSETQQRIVIPHIIHEYYKSICFDFYFRNKDKEMQEYYNYDKRDYSIISEKKSFFKESLPFINKKNAFTILTTLFIEDIKCIMLYPLKKYINEKLKRKQIYPKLVRIIKNR